MPKIHIKGSFAAGHAPVIEQLQIEGDCQTCGGAFEITIPYDLHAAEGTVQHLHSTATVDSAGKRTIKAK